MTSPSHELALGARLAAAGVPLGLPGALLAMVDELPADRDALPRLRVLAPLGDGAALAAWRPTRGEAERAVVRRVPLDERFVLALDDGATRGAVITWLRERYGHVNLCARMLPTDQGVSWWCYALSTSWLEDLPHAPTEQEALVRGAEWLAAGRWVTRTPQAPRPRVGGPPPRQRGQG